MSFIRDHHGGNAAETTPLINHTFSAAITEFNDQDGESATGNAPSKPLPKMQLFLLCYARVMEPIGFFCIFPYIAQMVQSNGHLPDTDVGFYSGLIESLFSATQMVVLIFWGHLADLVGRKPILIVSLVGSSLGPALFGMSTTLWQMIVTRCFAGVLSGSSLIIRTMIGDHSTPETQAVAFSWFAFAGNVGIFLGPLIGGALANPIDQYPSLFKGIAFFEDYPYALPGFVVAAINATAAVACIFCLEETLQKKEPDASTSPENRLPPRQSNSMRELVKAPGVGASIVVYCHVMLLAFCFTALLPVVLWTKPKDGGMGFSQSLSSLYFAAQGGAQATWLLLIFPFLQRRVGTKRTLLYCARAYPIFFSGYIIMNALLRNGSHAATVWFWIIGLVVCFVGPGVAMAFSGVQLALNDVSPSPDKLGKLNAIAMTCTSAIRSVVPGAATSLYAIGVRTQILGGQLAWVVLIVFGALLSVALRWLPDDRVLK